MAFKPTHYGKVWRSKGKSYRWAYSGNFGQWRKKQVKTTRDGRFQFVRGMEGQVWQRSPSSSAVPWRKYR